MQIIRKRQSVVMPNDERTFVLKSDPSRMFSFPCNEKGEIKFDLLSPQAIVSAETVVGNTTEYEDRGVKSWVVRWTEPAIGVCDCCGRHIELEGFTNTCKCGAEYNSAGQRLAARSQWGEETGEHPADIGRIR
jgi:hypothetical protein